MNSMPAAAATDGPPSGADPVAVAARHMYEAEVALHAARQSHVDAWVAAAYDHLHRAISEHLAALEATRSTQ
jgi:hypothetical protein